jgi:hypothetical protein
MSAVIDHGTRDRQECPPGHSARLITTRQSRCRRGKRFTQPRKRSRLDAARNRTILKDMGHIN